MAVVEISRIQVRRGQENQTGVPTLAGGEFGWAADTEHLYIGLRRDDGGARDANVRVLTENDLVNFFNVNQTLDSAYYTYRSETDTGFIDGITAPEAAGEPYQRLLRKKADDFVTIADFNVIGSGNETSKIQKAVDNLFLDPLKTSSTYGKTSAKVLYFPAGTYNIDTAIFCPAYTTIVGEGVGKTIINLTSNGTHAFQTVGSDPGVAGGRATFEDGISSGITQPNYLHIEGMTIQFDGATTNANDGFSLVSVDCSKNSIIRRVKFKGNYTTGIPSNTYVGIDIRGNGGLDDSSENLLIDACEFDGLYSGVKSGHDIVSPTIQNSKFYNSYRGVAFNDPKDPGTATWGPRYARILNNRFESIDRQAIYVGNGGQDTFHISSNNHFYNVGNNQSDETNPFTPVISFLTNGNITVNDYFNREKWQDGNSGNYIPLVEGHVALDSVAVKVTAINSATYTTLSKFPYVEGPQQLNVKYSVNDDVAFKTGNIEIFVPKGTNPGDVAAGCSFTENYTITNANDEDLVPFNWQVSFFESYYELQAQSQTIDVIMEHQTKLMI